MPYPAGLFTPVAPAPSSLYIMPHRSGTAESVLVGFVVPHQWRATATHEVWRLFCTWGGGEGGGGILSRRSITTPLVGTPSSGGVLFVSCLPKLFIRVFSIDLLKWETTSTRMCEV